MNGRSRTSPPASGRCSSAASRGIEEKSVDVEVGENGTVSVPDLKLGKPVDHDAVIRSLRSKASDLMQAQKAAEARKVYEDLLAKYPTQAQPPFRAQVHGRWPRPTPRTSGSGGRSTEEGRRDRSSNPDLQVAYGELLMQAGKRAEGEKVLLAMDLTKVKIRSPT